MTTKTDLLLWGIIAHFAADWFTQNEWQAVNKVKITHIAAWVHGLFHLLAMLLIFPPLAAALLALVHVLIDTRKPLQWWRGLIKQTSDPANPVFIPMAMWQDQVAHILCIAVAAYVVGK